MTTTTSFAPADAAGTVASTCVDETNTNAVAAAPPTVTPVAPVKFVPPIVICVAPANGPVLGVMEAIVGGER